MRLASSWKTKLDRGILSVEDRFRATTYATRNIVHWPVSIFGVVQ